MIKDVLETRKVVVPVYENELRVAATANLFTDTF